MKQNLGKAPLLGRGCHRPTMVAEKSHNFFHASPNTPVASGASPKLSFLHGYTGFSGYTYHCPTNAISVWVPTLEATEKVQTLQPIPVAVTFVFPVQAYLTSGTDLKRYVVSGVNVGQDQAILRACLTCPTPKVVSARYLGRSRTCLVTSSGPSEPPFCLCYYGCILRVRPYRPSAIFCYQCLRPGHMKASCTTLPKDADNGGPDNARVSLLIVSQQQ